MALFSTTMPGPLDAKTLPRRSPLGHDEVNLGGLPIAVIDRAASARLMVSVAEQRRLNNEEPAYITSANGEVLSRASDPNIRALFLAADMIHADGQPLVLASRVRGRAALPERTATTDLFHDTARVAQERGVSFYLLGGRPEVNARAVAEVRRLYPALSIAGARDGYFSPSQEDEVIEAINRAEPGILWVGLGVPREQTFAVANRHRLRRVGLIKTSGGLFDFLAGARSRAPRWMQIAGLEWLYRLTLEPKRLFWRYVLTNPHALLMLLFK